MEALAHRRIALTWIALAAITLLAWYVATLHGHGPLRADAAVAATAMGLAIVKVRVIVREFMDVRGAPALLKRVTDLWLAAFAAAMILAYTLTGPSAEPGIADHQADSPPEAVR